MAMKRMGIMKVLSCFFVFVILMSAMPISAFVMNGSNDVLNEREIPAFPSAINATSNTTEVKVLVAHLNPNQPPVNPTLTSDKPEPQFAGTAITWIASATDPDGDTLFYQFWIRGPSTGYSWTIKREWDTSSTWTWYTSSADIGDTDISVWIRDAHHAPTDSYDLEKIYDAYTIKPAENQPPVNPTLTSDKPEPQFAGTAITWTASATDPDGDTLFYQFWIRGPSTGYSWTMKRDWSTDSTWTWHTSSSDITDPWYIYFLPNLSGTDISVWIRDGRHEPPDSYDLEKVYYDYIIKPAENQAPPINPSLTPNKPEPQNAGTAITWTASATDPDGDTLYYRFWIRGPSTGNSWMIKRDWSTDNTWTWHTSPADIGYTDISVWIRDGHHAPSDSYDLEKLYYDYHIKQVENKPPTNGILVPTKAEPQPAGTSITWVAYAEDPDSDTLYYRFWIRGPSTGNLWQIMQDWSTDNTWTWHTSPADIGDTCISVWIRDGHHAPSDSYDLEKKYYDYTITPAENQPPINPALTPDKPEPQPAGAVIKWTASATDPDGDTLYYRFWIRGPSTGNLWQIMQDWSTDNTWTWHTSPADIGDTCISVWIRDGHHAPSDSYDLEKKYYDYTIAETAICKVQITSDSSLQDHPSIVYANGNYYVAYQSWETGYPGLEHGRDIFIKKFDYHWNFIRKVQVTSSRHYQDSPALLLANNKLYVAYVSNEEGATTNDWDVVLKEYDLDLNYINGSKRYLTTLQSLQDMPSLLYKDGYFYLAYQSWETGSSYQGDIYVKKFDSNWNQIKKVRVTGETSYQDRPSIIYGNGYFYVAYFSKETGNYDIFVKRLDTNLNLDSWKKQITSESSSQSYPSLKFENNEFAIAYASNEDGTLGIFMKKYDSNWNFIEKTEVVDDGSAHERRPSMTYAQNDYRVAYVHNSVGSEDWNIFAIIPSCEQPTPPPPPKLRWEITVDEAEYSAGDYVHLTLRFTNEGEDTVLITNPITTTFIAEDGSIVLEADLSYSISVTLGTGVQWSFGTSYKLPDDAPGGYYDVIASISGGRYVKTTEDLFFVTA